LVLNTAQAHFNEHLAESLPQQHRITFGGVTASVVIGLAMQDTGENAVEEVSLDKVRFRVPVLHGDTLYAYTEVVDKQEQPDDTRGYRDVGLIHFRHWGVNQRGEAVFEGERRVLVKKRAFVANGLEPAEAELPEARAEASSRPKAAARKRPAQQPPSRPKRVVSNRARAKVNAARRSKPASPRPKPRRGRR
jgi:itaconyl-CoA hydratase